MCPGMRPATGMDARSGRRSPFASSCSASSRTVVLRLRDREPVAGHEHDLARVRRA